MQISSYITGVLLIMFLLFLADPQSLPGTALTHCRKWFIKWVIIFLNNVSRQKLAQNDRKQNMLLIFRTF